MKTGLRKFSVGVLVAMVCAAAVHTFAANGIIADFGRADISAANLFWNVSGYKGISVWREPSALCGNFSPNSRTSAASSCVTIRTCSPGLVIIVF